MAPKGSGESQRTLSASTELRMAPGKAGGYGFPHSQRDSAHLQEYRQHAGRMIVLLTPGGFERLWEELGEPATQLTTPPPVDASVIEKLIALAPKYHLQIPPPTR